MGEGLDPAIVRRAREGDAQAFEAIVRHYQHRIYGLAYRLVYDAELARDIAQDVFLRLYQKLEAYDPERPFEPWFLRLATNYALNARQKARLRKALSLDSPIGPDGDARPEPEDEAAAPASSQAAEDEERRMIRQAVRDLPEKYAGVVALHYLEGLGVKDLSERLDMPAGTVKIRLHRARALLREKLARLKKGRSG